jgi:hypothetical protein
VVLVSDDVDALLTFYLFFGYLDDGVHALILVSRLQMLLQEGLVSKAAIAVHALGHFQVNLVVPAKRRLVAEGHEACRALMRLVGAVNE